METDGLSQALSSMSPTDQKEVLQLAQHTQQQQQVNELIHGLSAQCFKKCVTGKINSDSLSSSESSCAENCVGRWIDTQSAILKNLSAMQTQKSGLFS